MTDKVDGGSWRSCWPRISGAPSRRGNYRQPGAAYNHKQRRNAETAALFAQSGGGSPPALPPPMITIGFVLVPPAMR
jgi:hypothetical protein